MLRQRRTSGIGFRRSRKSQRRCNWRENRKRPTKRQMRGMGLIQMRPGMKREQTLRPLTHLSTHCRLRGSRKRKVPRMTNHIGMRKRQRRKG